MIRVNRNEVFSKIMDQDIQDHGFRKQVQIDAYKGRGDIAMAYLIKKGIIKFPKQTLQDELNHMVENSLMPIGQYDSMISLLNHASNGRQRVSNFLKKKRRITVVG